MSRARCCASCSVSEECTESDRTSDRNMCGTVVVQPSSRLSMFTYIARAITLFTTKYPDGGTHLSLVSE
jgi:hypothetical protein